MMKTSKTSNRYDEKPTETREYIELLCTVRAMLFVRVCVSVTTFTRRGIYLN